MKLMSWVPLSWCSPRRPLIGRSSLKRLFSTSSNSIYEELAEVASSLARHDQLYYESQEGPVISDAEYDALARREAYLCKEYPEIWKEYQLKSGLGNIATRYGGRVGSKTRVTESTSRTHAAKLLSLDNVHDTEQLLQWLERVRKKSEANDIFILSEPKLDGLSLALRYNTTLQWAATRGDGTTGTDVTKAIASIPNIPCSLPPNVSEVRGEVILPPNLAGNFSNARNAASGLLFRKEDEDDMRSRLRFYAYDTVPPMMNMREALINWGFTVPNPAVISTLPASKEPYSEAQIQPLLDFSARILSLRKTEEPEFDTDGCVHKLVDPELRETLGNSQRAPRWAVAQKFPPLAQVTELHDIVVQVGRTGLLTPVAMLSPISVLGVKIQRATLHNFEHLQSILKSSTSIPRNSTVLVRRAGDVIPQVMTLVHKSSEKDEISLVPPNKCPECGAKTIVDDAKAVRCSNTTWECPPQAIGALEHAFGRDALDIKGLSSAKLAQLRKEGFIQRPSDLFQLTKNQTKLDKVKELAGWGEKSAEKLVSMANKTAKQGVTLDRFLYSLGIPTIGRNAARLLAETYGSWGEVLQEIEEAARLEEECSFSLLRDETDETKGIGPILLGHLYVFARNRKLVDAAVDLAANLAIIDLSTRRDRSVIDGPLKDKTVVFAGTISKDLSRKEVQELARELGAKATPTKIAKSTGLLVAGPRSVKKRKEAESLGVPVMDCDEFLRIVAEYRNASDNTAQKLTPSNYVEDSAEGKLNETGKIQMEDDAINDTIVADAPFNGISVVFTGSIAKDCPRRMAQEIAQKLGAISTPSQVTKSTGLVVEGEKAAASKLKKADVLGVPIMRAAEFLQIAAKNRLAPSQLNDF